MRSLVLLGSAAVVVFLSVHCGGGSSSSSTGGDGGVDSGGGSGGGSGSGSGGGSSGSSSGSSSGAGSSSGSSSGGRSGSSSGSSSGGDGGGGSLAAGWLYTKGNHIYVSDGKGGGSVWMGRGVNMDDLFLCGYDNNLQDSNPGMTLQTIGSGLVSAWKPTFVRVSLSMNSFPTVVSWLSNPSQYAAPMTAFIKSLGANKGVYVLITLRSDASMIDEISGNDATFLPSDSTTTPNATKFPTGTDATYVGLVDSFADSNFVVFGLSNEPGGTSLSDATIGAAMNHAVGAIRAEEDRLKVPHHLVSVQGNGYTSDLSFYAKSPSPITYDNVVYELHYYPGLGGETPTNYSYASTLPMIVGEYGDFTSGVPQSAFYTDMESKQIPNLAWDFEPYSDCAPDLLDVNDSATTLTPTTWGSSVQAYLLKP